VYRRFVFKPICRLDRTLIMKDIKIEFCATANASEIVDFQFYCVISLLRRISSLLSVGRGGGM
jgi:hypothetical protein